tara:strand:- start:2829 stop:3167 length:339 start_codon:yes stop_codon:yes gene_type:complete
MTANQVYKLSGSNTPFSEWIGEQKNKYGEKFIANEEFLNATGFVDTPRSASQVVMDNADENIEFPKGAAVSGSVSLGGTEVSAGGSVKNIMPMVVLVGAIVVGVWAYKKYGK